MSNNSANNKRIAKNTILLYVRMLVTMVVGLFTSRVILDSLGIEDYGIYNVVGGFVAMFGIVRSGLVTSTNRFIAIELGKNDEKALRKTFSTCVIIYMFLAVLVVVIAEGLGVWFVNNKLNIPPDRLVAAHWCFQLSLLVLVLTFLSFPYNSLIIAHEKMSVFAYITIWDVIAKLAIAYTLYVTSSDRLIVYSTLLAFVTATTPFLYWLYCKRHYDESKIVWTIDWKRIKEIYSFTGWAMMGGFANMGYTQGVNILLGMFFQPAVNAARGVAVQVQGVVNNFIINFQIAIDPQITKSYARGDVKYMKDLVCSSGKYSCYLLLFLSLPVILEAETLFGLWLVEVPEYTVDFFRLIIVATIIDAVMNPSVKAIFATGNIRRYQVLANGTMLLVVPISYIALLFGCNPYSVFIVHILIACVVLLIKILITERIVGLNRWFFFRGVIVPVIVVTITGSILPLVLVLAVPPSLYRLVLVGMTSILCVLCSVYYLGMSNTERVMIKNKLNSYIKK